jgi:[NiFe] hydrogenase assembly HybE family chaperone
VPRDDDPTAWLEAHYRHVWETRMRDLPFVNAALAVEAIGFQRIEGDWLGVVITPWFVNLVLVYGGGQLWGDIPAGERRYLNLPCGTMQFIADDDPDIGPYQYCPLIAPVDKLPDMATARFVAADAIKTVFTAPPAVAEPQPRRSPKNRKFRGAVFSVAWPASGIEPGRVDFAPTITSVRSNADVSRHPRAGR